MFHSDDINLGVNGGDEKGKVIRVHILKDFGHDAREFTLYSVDLCFLLLGCRENIIIIWETIENADFQTL